MPNREECEAVVRQLWPYLDGVLPDEERSGVVDHLERCVNCRSCFEFERAFLEAVRAAGGNAFEEDFEPLRSRVVGVLAAHGFRGA